MRYEVVESSFWHEPDFESWLPSSKLLYLWAITNPQGHGITGISRATPSAIQLQTGLTPEEQEAAFEQIGGRIKRYSGGWIWLCARLSHTCKTEFHWKSVVDKLGEPSMHPQLHKDFMDKYEHFGPAEKFRASHPMKSQSHPSPTPVPPPSIRGNDSDSDSDSEPEPNKDIKPIRPGHVQDKSRTGPARSRREPVLSPAARAVAKIEREFPKLVEAQRLELEKVRQEASQ